jgi:hypothetical protein
MPVDREIQPLTVPCGCILEVDHISGQQLRSCVHDNWNVEAKSVIVYTATRLPKAKEAVQQARARSRIIDDSLSGV